MQKKYAKHFKENLFSFYYCLETESCNILCKEYFTTDCSLIQFKYQTLNVHYFYIQLIGLPNILGRPTSGINLLFRENSFKKIRRI